MLTAFAHTSSLVVHALVLLYIFAVPTAARRTTNPSYSRLPAFAAGTSQSSTEHGLTPSHTHILTAVLGVASLRITGSPGFPCYTTHPGLSEVEQEVPGSAAPGSLKKCCGLPPAAFPISTFPHFRYIYYKPASPASFASDEVLRIPSPQPQNWLNQPEQLISPGRATVAQTKSYSCCKSHEPQSPPGWLPLKIIHVDN
ncbi:hypothetical protein DFH09DRAFT_1069626 [Mycena vulgaris]|nr:hypothetical protein DFH09DRAFT_1069626 [Mycena vulgaris]